MRSPLRKCEETFDENALIPPGFLTSGSFLLRWTLDR
ncbi:hypothetical protein OKW29_001678 [Paraburkholderia sp. CI3]